MRVQIKRWGNSAALRLPSSIMSAAALTIDQPVEVREEDGRVVIEPIRGSAQSLASLLDAMTPETFHEAIDFGQARGEEIW